VPQRKATSKTQFWALVACHKTIMSVRMLTTCTIASDTIPALISVFHETLNTQHQKSPKSCTLKNREMLKISIFSMLKIAEFWCVVPNAYSPKSS